MRPNFRRDQAMLKRDTTFIIGAGASYNIGFPLGDNLRDQIIDLLRVDDTHNRINFRDGTIGRIVQDKAAREGGTGDWPARAAAYRQAAATIRDGLPFARSIDSFLDGLRGQPEIEFLGKLAIATVILRAESNSPLAFRKVEAVNSAEIQENYLRALLASWHSELGQILYDGHTVETIDHVFDHAAFIIFNYDRCIEEFLTISLMRRFAIERNKAMALVARCQIIHPYGRVGAFQHGEAHIPFGRFDDDQLVEVADGIRTFTEAMEDAVGDTVKDMVARAEVLVFMGFGWLPQNMRLLQVGERVTNAHDVFATTMGLAKGETDVVADQLDEILRRSDYTADYENDKLPSATFTTEHGDCKALMRNCWLRLTSR